MFEEHITLEELVRFVAGRFAPEELDTLIAMLSSIGLSIESNLCRGEVIKDLSRTVNKWVCTSCGNSYRTKPKYCDFTLLKRIPVESLVDITAVQKQKKVFKCETCNLPISTVICPIDHNKCLRVRQSKATIYGSGANTLEEYNKNVQKT